MKTDLIHPAVPPSQDAVAPPVDGATIGNPAARDQTIVASERTASGRGPRASAARPDAAASPAASAARVGGGSGDGNSQGRAAQRVALSRTRLEAMMLEAQAASSTGDVQRARSIARAVKMEAGAIRDALRAAADIESAEADAMARAAAAQAVRDAQEAAREAIARAASDDGSDLAPWNSGNARRDTILAESAPLGTPTTNLHRTAFEALRRAQAILEMLARIDGGERLDIMSDADGRTRVSNTRHPDDLLNQIEAEDGAVLDGWNLLA